MSDTCIVCLSDLPQTVKLATAFLDKSPADKSDNPKHGSSMIEEQVTPCLVPNNKSVNDTIPSIETGSIEDSQAELVAELIPCGHYLHNLCLKPWVQRANSCPICRANFNMVNLHHEVGGPIVSSYFVKDRRQVADLDPSMVMEFERADYQEFGGINHHEQCRLCGVSDNDEMIFCPACDLPYHALCLAIPENPQPDWVCFECEETDPAPCPPIRSARSTRRYNNRNRSVGSGSSSRTRPTSRPVQQSRTLDLAWESVWHSVFNQLDADTDLSCDDETASVSTHRRNRVWRRRLDLAARYNATRRFRPITPVPQTLPRPDRATQEEQLAWSEFERSRAQATSSNVLPMPQPSSTVVAHTLPRGRKRSASPSSSDQKEPERQLKRPRTRRTLESGEAIGHHGQAGSPIAIPDLVSPGESSSHSPDVPAPTFLQSLLQEVESATAPTNGELQVSIGGSTETKMETSRRISLAMTPPHSPPLRPASTIPLSTIISPLSPPVIFLSRLSARHDQLPSPPRRTEMSSSPVYSKERASSPGVADITRNQSSVSSPPPHLRSLSYSTKSELQKMVSSVMRPIYRGGFITKDVYTDVNRDISHRLYEIVRGGGGPGYLADERSRKTLQRQAEDEVENVLGDKYRSYVSSKLPPPSSIVDNTTPLPSYPLQPRRTNPQVDPRATTE